MSVRLFVCLMKSVLELTIFIFLSQVSLRSLCAYFVRQAEPKILRLVFIETPTGYTFRLRCPNVPMLRMLRMSYEVS